MAITIEQLIAKRESIKGKGAAKYELETSIGTVVACLPDAALVAEAMDITQSFESNKYIVYNCIIEPDLKNEELHKAYGIIEPTEIVTALFAPGEILKIANKLLDFSGFKGRLAVKIHEQAKN